jgi:hypothetical protein
MEKKTPDTKSLQKAVSENKPVQNGHGEVHKITIEDLYNNDAVPTVHRNSQLLFLVNQNPKDTWVRQHPMTKGDYMPIERVEWLLTQIFIDWKVEVKAVQVVANSVVVTIRLYYYNQIKKEWQWQDGIGASPIQTDKGAGAMDWNAVKSDSVMKAAPAAESYALKDAAEKIGKLFGRDLGRKETFGYDNLATKYENILD